MKASDTLLIGSDFSKGKDIGILTVGKLINGKVELVNAFQGKEAWNLFQKLTTLNPELNGETDGNSEGAILVVDD